VGAQSLGGIACACLAIVDSSMMSEGAIDAETRLDLRASVVAAKDRRQIEEVAIQQRCQR
jgi:hypothetical protein